MSVSMKHFDVQVHEINVKINTFKIGDGLIFGYVPRRYNTNGHVKTTHLDLHDLYYHFLWLATQSPPFKRTIC